jgi:T-complex protein 1 subunit alpha
MIPVCQMLTFADMEGGETFDSSFLGTAEEVVEERVADDDMLVIRGPKNSRAVSFHFTALSVSAWT